MTREQDEGEEPGEDQVAGPELAGNGRRREPLEPGEDELSPRDALIADAIARGLSNEQVAKACKVSERTVRRKRRELREHVAERVREALWGGMLQLQGKVGAAALALAGMATGQVTATTPRVAACRAVIELALRAVEFEDLLGRLDELEEIVNRRPGSGAWG
jgi:hypothetical protein